MKWIFSITLMGVILMGIFYVFNYNAKQIAISSNLKTFTEELLLVPPQEVKASVFIKQTVLKSPGFLVVRSFENNRLSQIIEVSSFLTAGEHKNITIDLGEFYDGATDLVVVVYEDAENDRLFNDLDQPIINKNNTVIARYVKTGKEVSSEMFIHTKESMPHIMGGAIIETILYTNQGFVPAQLTVPVGTIVKFVNESDTAMWVASNEHPGHTDLPTFDQFSSSEKTSSYTYTFNQKGTWAFHDHLQPTLVGVVDVF